MKLLQLLFLILIFFYVSAADAASVNPKAIKTLLANGLITLFINGNPVFSNEPSNLLRNPNCIIFDNWVFDNLISADELFAKDLQRLDTCLSVNNLWGKLVSLSPTMFDDNLTTTSDSFFIADFNSLSCECDSLTFKLLYCVLLYW